MTGYSILILIFMTAAAVGCGPNKRIMESAPDNRVAASESNATNAATVSSFEQDIEAMRTADFKFIVAFRRPDGQPLDSSDKEFISRNTGMQANRRRLSDEGKVVIIGSNFPFEAKPMKQLMERFKTDNYSKPDSGPMTFEPSPGPTQGSERR